MNRHVTVASVTLTHIGTQGELLEKACFLPQGQCPSHLLRASGSLGLPRPSPGPSQLPAEVLPPILQLKRPRCPWKGEQLPVRMTEA